jgi:hypothetical protein
MDFRTAVVKTLLGEEIDNFEMLDEEFLSLMEDNPFDELSSEALLEFMDSSLFELLDEKLAKASYVSAMRHATDPDGSSKSPDPDKIVARAKKVHGDKFAGQLAGVSKGNYPKTYGKKKQMVPGGFDKLSYRQSRSDKPSMITKAGKLTKNAQKGLKSGLKS